MRTPSRKIVVCIAASADGYIARPDGDVAWLERKGATVAYGLKAFLRSIDTIVWGRTTYEFALRHGRACNLWKERLTLRVHRERAVSPQTGVEFVNKPVVEFVKWLRSRLGKNIWLMGGARIIATFLDAGMVDES